MLPSNFGNQADLLSPRISSCLQQVIKKFKVEKMSPEEQTIFYLEFGRVAKLRFEKRSAAEPGREDKDKLFLEEIRSLARDLFKQK